MAFPWSDSFSVDGAPNPSNWTKTAGVWAVSGGRLYQTQAFNDNENKMLLWNETAPSADYYVQAAIYKDTTNQRTVNLVGRVVLAGGNATGYMATVRTVTPGVDQLHLYKFTGPYSGGLTSFTQLAVASEEFTSGTLVRLEMHGWILRLRLWDGLKWVTKVSASDSTYTAAGQGGFRVTGNGNCAYDDFAANVIPTYTISGRITEMV